MVDMSVRQNDCIDRTGIDGRLFPVSEAKLFHSLEKAAIQKDSEVFGLEQEFRTGDGLRRTQKRQLHRRLGYVTVVPCAFTNLVSWCSSTFEALKMCPA